MGSINKRLLGLVGLPLLAIGLLCVETSNRPTSELDRLPRTYPATLQEGDLVFSAGRDALSTIVLSHRKGTLFSHVGMLVKGKRGWSVIHATPGDFESGGGVRLELLDVFTGSQSVSEIGFYRVVGLSMKQRMEIKRYLYAQLEKPFDFSFHYSDDASQYCTELVLKALRAAGLDLEPTMSRVDVFLIPEPAIPPDSLLASQRLRALPVQSSVSGIGSLQ